MAYPPLKAIIHINATTDPNDIKRLGLFFDELHYVMPALAVMRPEVVEQLKDELPNADARTLKIPDYLKGITRNWELGTVSSPLKDAIDVFKESGIARQVDRSVMADTPDRQQLEDVRALFIALDSQDPEFNALSGTAISDYTNAALMEVTLDDKHEPRTIYHLTEPLAIIDSSEITTSLYLGHALSGFPVFLESRHRKEVAHRYRQYKDGLEVLRRDYEMLATPIDFKVNFGEVVFSVANAIIASELISRKSPEEIVAYRGQLEESRKKYLSHDLMEIASIVNSNPWSHQVKSEVEKYVFGKLHQDLVEYDTASREIWEKLFGRLTVNLTDMTKLLAAGGSTGGLLGNLLPNVSTWEMLLIGAITGIAAKAPKLTSDLVDAIVELRKEKRSSIAYISNFS